MSKFYSSRSVVFWFALSAWLFPAAAAAVESPWRDTDRIAISMDGNGGSARTNHQYTAADPDDIGASAVALAIIAKRGLQDNLVHFDFNNWLDVGPVPEGKDHMSPSVYPAAERWGFNRDVFFDLTTQADEGVAHLTEAINASSAESHLFIVAAGPIESIYRAVEKAQPSKRRYATLISHSNYNEMHLIQDDHRTIEDFKPFRENDGLGYIKIKDQNAKDNPNYLWHAGTNFEVWSFLRDSDDPDYRWLFSRIKAHTYNKSDVSDAGMVYFLLMNDENGSPAKLEALLGEGMDGAAAVDSAIILTAGDDFTHREVEGFVPAYFDKARDAIAVNAGRYKDVFTAAESEFPGGTGRYDITLTSLTELDGESSYRLVIDGETVGQFQNPTTDTDYAPHQHTFPGVEVAQGVTIRIESSSVSNDKIPEGDGFAYARGRWREVSFKPTGEAAETVTGHLVQLEAEDMEVGSGWELRRDELASGGQYLAYTGPNSFKQVTPHRLRGTLTIEAPGRYTVKWFMRQPDDVPGDQANDVWLDFPDANQYGHGEVSGFNKFLGRSKGTFGLNGTVEVQHKQAWLSVEFPEPGRYTVEIAGRSQGLQLDASCCSTA